MKKLPENAKKFFSERAEEVICPEDKYFISKLEHNDILRNQIYPQIESVLITWNNWERFLTLVIDCASLAKPENVIAAKEAKEQAEEKLQEIIRLSKKLADSIDDLNELGELGFIHVPYNEDVIGIILQAGKEVSRFDSYVKEPLIQATISKRDDRYLPSLSNFIRTMANNYEEESINFSRHYEEIITSRRYSPRLFCTFLDKKISEFIECKALPTELKLSHKQMADFYNALFETSIGAEDVKSYFAVERKRIKVV